MNERIRELIKQMDQASLPYGDNAMTVTDRDLEYFAELIVKEVTNIVLHYTDVDEGVAVAKKHFGVEE